MELVSLVCLFVVAWTGIASADGPTVVPQVAKEDGEVVLNCHFGKNVQGKVFDWRKDGDTDVFMLDRDGRPQPGRLFQGRVSHFAEALHSGNASIVIRPAKASDSGTYTCYFPHDPPETRSIISLTVGKILKDRSPEKIPGAAAKLSLRSLQKTKESSLLQCEVQGAFPKPLVEWQDSAGNILPADEHVTKRDDKFDVTLQTTVTKTDNYSCVSTQKELHHRVAAWTHEHFHGAVTPQIEILDETSEWALLQCFVRGVSPKTKLQWKDSFQNVVPAKEPEVIERGGSYDITLQTTVTKSDDYYCVATQENGLQTQAKTYIGIGGTPYGVVIGIIVGIVGTLLIVGVVYVLKKKGCTEVKSKTGESHTQQDGPTAQKSVSGDMTSSDAAAGLLPSSSGQV